MMRPQTRRLQARSPLLRDARGVALIEFAIVLPFLIVLFIGGFQLMDAISAYRKVGKTVRTLADLTTQNTTITATGADQILAAAQQVMAPYAVNSSVLRISQIQVDGNRKATVGWSRALNGTALTTGAPFAIPAGLSGPNRYYIYSEITYTYTPAFASALIGKIPLSQTIFMSPRNSPFVAPQQGPLP